jgi:hypothetical protein
MPERDTAKLLRLITEEIWCQRRYERIDELISEDLVDHVEMPGLEGTGRARYRTSVRLMHRVRCRPDSGVNRTERGSNPDRNPVV